ncbi:MAG: XkdF-like putative serine protease domain-containing protein, partial [Sphaerochaetaceae bacterium]
MRKDVNKAIEITDASISYVSLVDKAANKRQFLFAKDKDGGIEGFTISSKLFKADDGSHTVIGIVYEPGVEDAHGNFMKAAEIKKAADDFAENGEGIDMQHNGVVIEEGITIVKSWVTEEEQELYGEVIKAGTWLMQLDITDEDLWGKIEKGEITGFSMGGSGTYILEDVEPVEKSEGLAGVVQSLLKALGMEKDFIQKGEVMDRFRNYMQWDVWYDAKWALEDTLMKWDDINYVWLWESDPAKIREALQEFSDIISTLLTTDNAIENMVNAGISKELEAKITERDTQKVERIEKSKGDDDMNEAQVKEIVKSE